jgi:pimeloyl-ACP methyl ester carboxylesterase
VRVDEHTIELAGSPVFLRRAAGPGHGPGGSPGPPPLYLHGIPTSSDDWIELLARTGGIAPDLIGFGRSGKGGQLDISIEGHADFLERLLSALAVERVKLVMHDWGAAGGLVFAQRHPDRVERLVLLNALPLLPGFRWSGLARVLRRPLLGELAMGTVNRRLLARFLGQGSADPRAWSRERVDALWHQFDQGTQRAILRLHRDAGEERLERLGSGLSALPMPALVLWGTRDPWRPPAFAEAYAELLPSAELELLPDAAHWPWRDAPAAVDRITGFLLPR